MTSSPVCPRVLSSRLRPPPPVGVRRDRLLQLLADAPLALVVAPPGCGKTVLLGHLATTTSRHGWLTADRELAERDTFVTHLVAALSAVPELAQLDSTTVAELLDEVDARLRAPATLVVDDVHTLDARAARHQLGALIAGRPRLLRILLAGRRLPRIGVERCRLSVDLTEIGPDELCFRPDEVAAFADASPQIRRAGIGADRLLQETGGWPAAMRLADCAATPTGDGSHGRWAARLRTLTRRYLEEQVLSPLDRPSREVLGRVLAGSEVATSDSAALAELARRGLIEGDPRSGFRAYEALRPHLLDALTNGVPAPSPHVVELGEPRDGEFGQAAAVHIRTFGGFEVTVAGEPVCLATLRPQHRALLAVFCIHADQVLHRDQLIAWFWPDSDPTRARHCLQVAVSELRRTLRPPDGRPAAFGLVSVGDGYRLRLDAGSTCDVRELELMDARAAAAAGRGDRAAELAQLSGALALYRGELVPAEGYPEWILAERDRLRQVAAGLCERLVILRADLGDHAGAVAAARAGLTHHRHHDPIWRQLVTSLLALDDRVAAAAVERSYRQVLMDLSTS